MSERGPKRSWRGTLVAFSCLTRTNYCVAVLNRARHLRSEKGALVIINKGERSRFEEELPRDLLSRFAVFLPRLYGSHPKCQKWVDVLRDSLMEA